MQTNGRDDASDETPAPRPDEVEADVRDADDVVDAPAGDPDPSRARIAELETRLREAEGRLRAVSKAYTDQKNEMHAFRERVEAQAARRLERREFEAVGIFFEPVQNLQRSLEAGIHDPDSFLAGLHMVHAQFVRGLEELGLERVPGVGASFDPNLHEALAVAPVEDPSQDGKVLVVHEDGYRVGSKVLHAAKVVIGRHTGEEVPEA